MSATVQSLIERGGTSATLGASGSSANRTFRLQVSERNADPVEVCRAPGIPAIGAAHPILISMRADTINARRVDPEDSHTFWDVTVNYVTPPGLSTSGGDETANPLAEPAKVAWGVRMVEVPATETIDGSAIANSAGQPFDNPPMIEEPLPVVTVIRNQSSFSVGRIDDIVGSVNKADEKIAGFVVPARKGLLEEYSGERVKTGALTYWIVTYRVVINVRTWDARVADQGFLDSDGNKQTDAAAEGHTTPGNLFGGAFADVADVLKFRIRREETWGLKIGNV